MERFSYMDMKNSAFTNNRNSMGDMSVKNSYYQPVNEMNASYAPSKGFGSNKKVGSNKNFPVGVQVDDYLYQKRPYHLKYICKKCLSVTMAVEKTKSWKCGQCMIPQYKESFVFHTLCKGCKGLLYFEAKLDLVSFMCTCGKLNQVNKLADFEGANNDIKIELDLKNDKFCFAKIGEDGFVKINDMIIKVPACMNVSLVNLPEKNVMPLNMRQNYDMQRSNNFSMQNSNYNNMHQSNFNNPGSQFMGEQSYRPSSIMHQSKGPMFDSYPV